MNPAAAFACIVAIGAHHSRLCPPTSGYAARKRACRSPSRENSSARDHHSRYTDHAAAMLNSWRATPVGKHHSTFA